MLAYLKNNEGSGDIEDNKGSHNIENIENNDIRIVLK